MRRSIALPFLLLLCGSTACSRTPRESKSELRSASVPRADAGSLAATVDLREYEVPTADALPHDPAVAPDGALWVTLQRANKLARLDPWSGSWQEYRLRTDDSGPHGLVVDEAGNVWFTANAKAYIGKLHPGTGELDEYRFSDPRAKDPHTPILGPNGILWFTVQRSNLVGKLDRRTGAATFVRVPTANALPYGMVLGLDGAPYVCEFGSNKIARVDPASLEMREYPLPDGARPRRIALSIDGLLFYSDFARGRLGRLDPRSGRVDEWLSPGGALAKPYGIAITPDGLVWYSESGITPNTLVRFDPKTQMFATMPIPSGGGVVRSMAATQGGRVFLAESGMNKVAVVRR
jgi:virginiamycin B lyase